MTIYPTLELAGAIIPGEPTFTDIQLAFAKECGFTNTIDLLEHEKHKFATEKMIPEGVDSRCTLPVIEGDEVKGYRRMTEVEIKAYVLGVAFNTEDGGVKMDSVPEEVHAAYLEIRATRIKFMQILQYMFAGSFQ